jgi:hypothetical protein
MGVGIGTSAPLCGEMARPSRACIDPFLSLSLLIHQLTLLLRAVSACVKHKHGK